MQYGPFPRLKVDDLLSVRTRGGLLIPHGLLADWTRDIYEQVRRHPHDYVEHRWFFRVETDATLVVAVNPWAYRPSGLLCLGQVSGWPLTMNAIGRPVQFHAE